MQLNKTILLSLAAHNNIILPPANTDQLPEKVLQFGTGVLLRGLPDYYINNANAGGVFNGRIVVVKSTQASSIDEYAAQDHLYTHCIKGMEDNAVTEKYLINAAISRVINANDRWSDVLSCASDPLLQIIISNTTEAGIALLEEDKITASPPQSFPGKLLAFLYRRYQAFNGSLDSGMVIVPTELIVDNGGKLKDIVITLAGLNSLEKSFIDWLTNANNWCSSLVDRIVPGALPEEDKNKLEKLFGYTDKLAIMSEPYNLWAIETKSERVRNLLSFSKADKGIIITPDISKYRELKLRLLNATHTFSCGLAFISQFGLVNEAMQNKIFQHFVSRLMYDEIIPCIVSADITTEEAKAFAGNVIDRFSNTFIQHQWLAITLQYTGKIKSRCVPLIRKYYNLSASSQTCMALGFAAYLLFMKAVVLKDKVYYGERDGKAYLIQDEEAEWFYILWKKNDLKTIVSQVLEKLFFENETNNLPEDFAAAVLSFLQKLMSGTSIEKLILLATDKTP